MSDPRLQTLLDAAPGLRLKTDPADLEHYGRDWTRRWTPAPLAIALPATVKDVQAVVQWANDHHVAVVPSGGRTGLSGGAVAASEVPASPVLAFPTMYSSSARRRLR